MPGDEASGADTLGALGNEELAGLLYRLVNVIALGGAVGKVVVGDIVETVLLEELGRDDPGAVLNDLVNPLAVAKSLGTLHCGHDGQTLAHVSLAVTSDADNESGVGESLLGLLELAHVTARKCVLVYARPGRAAVRSSTKKGAYPRWKRSKTPSA